MTADDRTGALHDDPPTPRRGRRLLIVATVVAVGVVTVGTAAWAAIPDSRTGKITACVVKKGPRAGALRVIDAQRNERCLKSERTISWTSQAPRFRGEYRSGVVYRRDDVVTRGGSTYIATVKAKVALTSAPPGAGWTVLAQRGATGATGATGPTGPAGAPGATGATASVVRDQVSHTVADVNALSRSVTIGTDGRPIMSLYDADTDDLVVVVCSDAVCSSATTRIVDGDGLVGSDSSITIGTDGNPVISYRDADSGDLNVALCSDPECIDAQITPVDTVGNVGADTSITIGADGNPIIGYRDVVNDDLKVAHCSDPQCTSSTVTTVDTTGVGGFGTSIAIGSDGLAVLVHQTSGANDAVRFVRCTTVTCSSSTSIVLDDTSDMGSPEIAIGIDGNPIVAYSDFAATDLVVAHCQDLGCTSTTRTTFATPGVSDSLYMSMALGSDGLAVISHVDVTNDRLVVDRCIDIGCSAIVGSALDEGTEMWWTAITIGADGNPIVAYSDDTNDVVKVLACGSVSCSPSVRIGR